MLNIYSLLPVFASVLLLTPLASAESPARDCSVTPSVKYISGESMNELFKAEESITVEEGWYKCHPVERDDIVLIQFPHRSRPIIKLARVLPGDRFHLELFQGGHHLLVNDKILKTPKGTPYLFGGHEYKMLALYEESFHGLMPTETYFVFGTVAGGSFDSTRFGPVKVGQLTGRVR